tara:strand:+ start:104 stop:871 length:768 start_codon:yes stop_codon:yes gene_type:complete
MHFFTNFLSKINFFISENRSTKIFGGLIFLTIFLHICIWPVMHLTEGSFWIYGDRIVPQYKYFSPALDGGYFEHFQYILLIWCCALSIVICLRQNKFTYPIPLIYFFLFLDDSLSLHDSVFNYALIPFLSKTILSKIAFIPIKGFAEITYWLIVLIICLLLISPIFKYGNLIARKFIKTNFKFFILLAFFGSFVDVIGGVVFGFFPLKKESLSSLLTHGSFILIEEIGEITIIAFVCIWLIDIVIKKKLLINSTF